MSGTPAPSATLFQTFAVSGQIVERPYNLLRVGPEAAAQFLLADPATVSYGLVTGGPAYTDTVQALVPAQVYGKPGQTTVDLRVARYVTFLVPMQGKDAAGNPVAAPTSTLYIADEGYFNFIAQQGYVIPLHYIWLHGWQIYQNTAGVATPPPGGAARGSGWMGAFLAQSVNGGGALANVNFKYGSAYAAAGSTYGLYFQFPSAPARDTCLFSVNLGTYGYYRVKLSADLSLTMEYSLYDNAVTPATTLTESHVIVAAGTLQPNTWYWHVGWGNISNGPTYQNAVVLGPAGAVVGSVQGDSATQGTTVAAQMGIGHDVTGAAYADWPNSGGWLWSKFLYNAAGSASTDSVAAPQVPVLFALPHADPAAGTYDLQYLCRDGLGAEASLIDSGKLGLNLPASSVGLTVVAAGPYA